MTAPVPLREETVHLWDGMVLAPVRALRWEEFALVQNREGGWVIAHVPSGAWFAGVFRTVNLAAAAAVDIRRLRNDWTDTSPEMMARLDAPVLEIIGRYGRRVSVPDDYTRDERWPT